MELQGTHVRASVLQCEAENQHIRAAGRRASTAAALAVDSCFSNDALFEK